GFVPLPFADYLEELAGECSVRLEPLLAWFHAPDPARPDEAGAPALAQLGRALGFGADELLLHVRLGFAALQRAPLPSPAAARSVAGAEDPLTACRRHLEAVEERYEPAAFQELRRIEAALRAAL